MIKGGKEFKCMNCKYKSSCQMNIMKYSDDHLECLF